MPASVPQVRAFFDETTSTFTYVLFERDGGQCAVIDPVLDYDPTSGRTSSNSADAVVRFVCAHRLQVCWLLETHAHADHLSAAAYLKRRFGGKIAIGEGICVVQRTFRDVFNLRADFSLDGSQFDHLFTRDEVFSVGGLLLKVVNVPGHTRADVAYVVENGDGEPQLAFIGDTLLMPDVGTARCDFPGGDARTLYASARKLLAMPPATALYVCHDYPGNGRGAACKTSVIEQRMKNIHVHDGVDVESFIEMREKRDATLSLPRLMLPAVQVNIRAGDFPPADSNGRRYLKIPLNVL